MNEVAKEAIKHVINAGGNYTVESFDDDHDPIGPLLRQEIMPFYVQEEFGKLIATDAGRAICE